MVGYQHVGGPYQESYGLQRLDHAVGNVHCLKETVSYLGNMTGFHQFAEFSAEDVGTIDSGASRAQGIRVLVEPWICQP